MRIRWSRVVLCLAAPLVPLWGADVKVMEEIVAKVNGDIVTRTELEKSRQGLVAALQQRGAKGAQLDQALTEQEKDILRDRIDHLLLIQKGKELNITVDSEITKQMAEIQKQAGIADPDKFQQYVREQVGMPFEDYRSEMRNNMLTQRVIQQEVGRLINIPRDELRGYYDEHKAEFMREDRVFLSEIFLSTAGKDATGAAAADKKAKDLVARAKKGEKFHELARDNSEAESAKNFGEIGGAKKEDLRKEIADAVWEQRRGFVTDPPIRLEGGFLILRVDERHVKGQAEFEEIENQITQKLYMQRFQPKIREYLTQLRQDAFLEIKEGYVDSSAAPGKSTRWTDPAQLKPETVTKEEVANKPRRKRLLWVMPVPGTKTSPKSSSKS